MDYNNKWEMCPWDTDNSPTCISYTVIKVTFRNFEIDLYFVVKSIWYMFHNIWLRQAKVRKRK